MNAYPDPTRHLNCIKHHRTDIKNTAMINLLKKLCSLFIMLLFINKINAQVGIGTLTPDPSAALHVYDTARGMLIPRLTSAQRAAIQSPAEGLLIYQTSDYGRGFWYFTNGQWKSLA